MKMIIKIARVLLLILFCSYSLFFVIGSTLAPIMAHFEQYELSALLTSTYMFSCHQQPDRSFWLFGYPVALCCRCYGFYIGVCVSAIAALLKNIKMSLKTYITIFLLCLADIILNFCIKLDTGNITRFAAGVFMGMLFIIGLNYLLKTERKQKYEN